MSTINDLANKVARLTNELRDATQSYHNALIGASEYKPGAIYVRRKNGQRAIVQKVTMHYGTPRPILLKCKKDGTPGLAPVGYFSKEEWIAE